MSETEWTVIGFVVAVVVIVGLSFVARYFDDVDLRNIH